MTILLLAGMALLVLVNGFFVAAEFAYVRANRGRLEVMATDNRGAAVALTHLDDLSHHLAACQFGITLASLGIGFLGEPAVAWLAEPVLGGVASHAVSVAIALLVAYVISTAAHITVGEQVPKLFAIANAEDVARRVARPLGVFARVFGPAISVLDATSNAMLRPLGVRAGIEEPGTSPEDLKVLIAESLAGGGLERDEAEMLSGVFRLSELEARRVMTPLPAVVGVRADQPVETALDCCIDTGHTRLLVRDDDGAPVGAVHVNDLARALRRGEEQDIRGLARVAPVVPETRRLDDVLADLQRDRASMAAVVDEYGRLAGIVTVEDIVEEVVGEIVDETDSAVAPVRRLADGVLFARGDVALYDLADDHDVHLPASEAVSVGGWVFDRLGRLPRRGDSVEAGEHRVVVDTMRENRIESVRITPTPG
ncbi:MAG: hemolysin family protein [Solirubrobacteraceae bacterium]